MIVIMSPGPSAAFTILGYVADIAAMLAAIAAVTGLYFAWRTVVLAGADKRQSARDRRRERLESIRLLATTIEGFAYTDTVRDPGYPPTNNWKGSVPDLRRALTGLEAEIPDAIQILDAPDAPAALNAAQAVGPGVQTLLDQITEDDARAAAAGAYREPGRRRVRRPPMRPGQKLGPLAPQIASTKSQGPPAQT